MHPLTKQHNKIMANEVTTVLNAQLRVTSVTQTANADLGSEEKTLYYLIIITDLGKEVINIGQKTHDKVKALLPKPKGGKS